MKRKKTKRDHQYECMKRLHKNEVNLKGFALLPTLQINGKVKITASGAAKPDNCQKATASEFGNVRSLREYSNRTELGCLSVWEVFIEQVYKWKEMAYDRHTGVADKQCCQWQPVILSIRQLTGQLLSSSTPNTTDWLQARLITLWCYCTDHQSEHTKTHTHALIINVSIYSVFHVKTAEHTVKTNMRILWNNRKKHGINVWEGFTMHQLKHSVNTLIYAPLLKMLNK